MNCPYQGEANWMCSVLVREVSRASTWKDKNDACMAIIDVRREEKSMVAEWEHLNGNSQSNTFGGDVIPDKV